MTDLPWINEEIKCKIKSKNKTFQQYFKNGRKITDFENVDKEAAELSEMIPNWKDLRLETKGSQFESGCYV